MNPRTETIAAIATGAGGGIGVVRVSGPRAREILGRLVRPWPPDPESHRLYLGRVIDPSTGAVLDEVLACLMAAPRSYTGDDVAELSGHGGARNLARLLAVVLESGARLAAPGEFTRRAFLSGRLDLTQAEAVGEVIAARSEEALRLAQAHLGGALKASVAALRAGVVGLLAELEAGIDFSEENLDLLDPGVAAGTAEELAGRTRALAESHARGRRIAHGAEVALVGRPNAGKSSLLNALCGVDRALVDSAPGTTRDYLEMDALVGAMRVRLIDTAGERADRSGASVEARGIALGRRRRAEADLRVVVIDGTVGFEACEAALLAEPGPAVLVWNKADVAPNPAGLPAGVRAIAISAARGFGLDALRDAIAEALDPGARGVVEPGREGAIVTTERQRLGLARAAANLADAAALLRRGEPVELGAVELRAALAALGGVLGESVDRDVLDALFARFCIGK